MKSATSLTGYIYFTTFVVACCGSSCDGFITVESPTSRIVKSTVFMDEGTARAATSALYHQLQVPGNFAAGGQNSITALAGLTSDEFRLHSGSDALREFDLNELTSGNSFVLSLWGTAYNTVYLANSVLEGLANSTSLSDRAKAEMMGECKFIRAFCNFYLVNLFGDIPLILTTDYRQNAVASRTPVADVYAQIVADLQEAHTLLPPIASASDRTRPTKAVASAMLARVYLFVQDWESAARAASEVIVQTDLYQLVDVLDDVFLKDSKETIWQLLPVDPNYNTGTGNYLILTADPSVNSTFPISLSNSLMESWDAGDGRRSAWIGDFIGVTATYNFAHKYKVKFGLAITEYTVALRLAELLLIRAEATAHLGRMSESLGDLNALRRRAGLEPLSGTMGLQESLAAIVRERRIELMAEWGHRWFDLKRTNTINAVMAEHSPTWQDSDALYPIPEMEIINAPNLQPQNPGY